MVFTQGTMRIFNSHYVLLLETKLRSGEREWMACGKEQGLVHLCFGSEMYMDITMLDILLS